MKIIIPAMIMVSLFSTASAQESLITALRQSKDPATVYRRILMEKVSPWPPPSSAEELLELNKDEYLEPVLGVFSFREYLVDFREGNLPTEATVRRSLGGFILREDDYVKLAMGGVHSKTLISMLEPFPVKFTDAKINNLKNEGIDPRLIRNFSNCTGLIKQTTNRSIIPVGTTDPSASLIAAAFDTPKIKEEVVNGIMESFNSRIIAVGSKTTQRIYTSAFESDKGTKPSGSQGNSTTGISNGLASAAAPASYLSRIPGIGNALVFGSVVMAFAAGMEYNVSAKNPDDVEKIPMQPGLHFMAFRDPGVATLVPLINVNGKPTVKFHQGGMLLGGKVSPVGAPIPISVTHVGSKWTVTPTRDLVPGSYAVIWGKKENDFKFLAFEIVPLGGLSTVKEEQTALAIKQSPELTSLEKLRGEATQGDAPAQYNLGTKYLLGDGVPQDFAEAVKWWRKAGDQGYANAQSDLGINYTLGEGAQQDHVEAVKWFRKAADQGNVNAQFNLGLAYDLGRGVQQDNIEANAWLYVYMGNSGAYRKALSYRGSSVQNLSSEANQRTVARSFELLREIPLRGLPKWTGEIAKFSEEIQRNPRDADGYGWRAQSRMSAGDNIGAIADYDKAIEINPSNLNYLNARATLRFSQKDYKGTLADAERAIALKPNHYRAYNIRGAAKEYLKDLQGALDDFQRAVELCPIADPNHDRERAQKNLTRVKAQLSM